MRPTQKRGLFVGVALVIAVLLVNAGVALRQAARMHADASWVAHTHEVLSSLRDVLSTMKDAETGVRGFLVTGQTNFLEPYENAHRKIDGSIARFAVLTVDNPIQQARVPRLKELVANEMAVLAAAVAAQRQGGTDAARKTAEMDRGKAIMDSLRTFVGEMEEHERELRVERQQANDVAYRSAIFSSVLSAVLGLMAVAAFLWLLRAHLKSLVSSAAAIYEQREWFRTTLGSIGDAVIATDMQGRITFQNSVAEALTGWTEDAARGQSLDRVFRIVNEETRRTVENPSTRALREGMVVGLANHTVLIAKDGKECAIDDSAAPIRNEHGEVAGVVLVFRDVGARRETERALQASEARKAAILRASLDAIITIDGEGKIVEFNPAAESLFGHSPAEAFGQELQQFIIPEGTRGSFAQELTPAPAASMGLPLNTRLEFPARRKDGSELFVELVVTRLEGSARPLFTVFLRDITGQKQSHEKIARLLSNERQRSQLLGQVATASLTINSATSRESVLGVITSEACHIVGAKQAEVLFNDDKTQLPIPDGALAVPLIGRSGQPFAHLVVGEKSGGDFDADDKAVLAQLALMAAVAFDNARLNEELRETGRHKDEFLATLAHELRNPLAPIRNALQVMRLARDDSEVMEASETIIDRQVQQMVRLIDDLLDLSRISRGKIELRRERIDLADVLNSAIETSRPLIEESGHQLTVRLPSEPLPLDADLTRLAQVFLNLLNNSAKYTERGGQICLTAERAGDTVAVRVRDTGIGIPPQMLPRIFEMFTQVDRSLERAQGGLGIGLTLVRRLVEMHGGSVEAHSDGPGTGSEFIVRLPLVRDVTADSPRAAADDDAAVPAGRRHRILVVDDNRDAANSLTTLLRMKGHDVRTAYDGLEAIDATFTHKPDVVLLDVGLPRLNGFDVARRIREGEHARNVVLIALTGWGHEEDRRRSKEAGFDHHMVKPADPVALDRVLESLTPRSGAADIVA
jgi:PAS domain S-box-containing protein